MKTMKLVTAAGLLLSVSSVALAQDVQPVEVDALYVGDVLTTLQGGAKKNVDYIDDVRLSAVVDTEALLGIPHGTAYVSGRAFLASDYSGSHLGEFQKVSNIDTFTAVRLYEAWYEQRFQDDRLSIRAGLYDLNAEFDVTPPATLFLNASQGIGTDFGQTGFNGPSIFPVTSLSARVAWIDPSGFSVLVAVLDGAPGSPNHPKRTAIKLSKDEGALVTGEVQYLWDGGKANIGAWTYTARFDDFRTAAAAVPTTGRGNAGVYGSLSGLILGEAGQPMVEAYVRVGAAAPAFNTVSTYAGGGFVVTGLIPGRPEDKLGLAVGYARTGAPYRQFIVASGDQSARAETILELSYRAELASWIAVQPDFQAIIRPGFGAGAQTGYVAGLRFEINPLSLLR